MPICVQFEPQEEELPEDPKERAEYLAEKKRKKEKEEKKADRVMQNATSISGGGSATVNDRDRNKKHGGKSGKKRSK